MNLSLVHSNTPDGYYLSGLMYSPAEKLGDIAATYVHGAQTDFYSFPFVQRIGESLAGKGIPMIAVQTRGTGRYSEVLKTNLLESDYIGTDYELLEDAHFDIDAWIGFLQEKGYTKFILIGHSLGTHKIARYLFEGKHAQDILKLSFLGPFDKNAYMERRAPGKWGDYVNEAKLMVESGRGLEMIPATYDDSPVTYQNFYSWFRPSEFNEMWDFYRMKQGYDFPLWNKIKIPVQVITGKHDEDLLYPEFYTKEEAFAQMREMIPGVDLQVIPGTAHCFVSQEEMVAKEVARFVTT
jgi:pimeloyl-ACP methyl ester carboxylesterase